MWKLEFNIKVFFICLSFLLTLTIYSDSTLRKCFTLRRAFSGVKCEIIKIKGAKYYKHVRAEF